MFWAPNRAHAVILLFRFSVKAIALSLHEVTRYFIRGTFMYCYINNNNITSCNITVLTVLSYPESSANMFRECHINTNKKLSSSLGSLKKYN